MSDFLDLEDILREALSGGQRRRQMIRRLNKALPPGRNRWFISRQAARCAAQSVARQLGQRTGRAIQAHHHIYRPLGLPHYHLSTPDGRFLRMRFIYIDISPNREHEATPPSGHGGRYQTERQIFLRKLLDDKNQPRFIHGWVRQQLNRLERIKRAHQTGQQPPGGSRYRLKGIPGFDVGHSKLGHHDHRTFRLEHASSNRARPGFARRLKIKHIRESE